MRSGGGGVTEAAGDRITTLLSRGAGAAPGRQLSRWSACSKLPPTPPEKNTHTTTTGKQPGPLLCAPFFPAEEVFGSVARAPGWRPLCTAAAQRNHADKEP